MKALLAALMLTGIAAVPAAAQSTLDGTAIKRLVSGRSASWVNAEGRAGVITYHHDGKLSAQAKVMGMTIPVSGTWEVRGNKFCRTIRMDSPPTKCQSVIRARGSTYHFIGENGKLATMTTFE